MKFVADRPLFDPDLAARKLVEIANGVEAVQDGRIHIERVKAPFLAILPFATFSRLRTHKRSQPEILPSSGC